MNTLLSVFWRHNPSFCISISISSISECSSTECNSFGDFETLVILPAILVPTKSPVTSAVF